MQRWGVKKKPRNRSEVPQKWCAPKKMLLSPFRSCSAVAEACASSPMFATVPMDGSHLSVQLQPATGFRVHGFGMWVRHFRFRVLGWGAVFVGVASGVYELGVISNHMTA